MNFSSKTARLSFVSPFEISKLVRSHQDVLQVEIHDEGLIGYGETPAIPYYGKDVLKMNTHFQAAIPKLAEIDWSAAQNWYPELLKIFPLNSFIRSAIDGAAWDLLGKKKKTLVWKLLGLKDPRESFASNFTIGIGSVDYVIHQIVSNPWPFYKLKLGSEKDQEVLRAVSLQTNSPLRLDANGAWTVEETKSFLSFCENELPSGFIEMIEEPYRHMNFDDLGILKGDSTIPFYADESFQSIDDLEKIAKVYHGINVKLDKCGGLTPALEIIKRAKGMGLKIQLGCMSSSGISLAPAIQLSSMAEVIDLDAAMLVVDADFGVDYANGVAYMAGDKGHGIVIN